MIAKLFLYLGRIDKLLPRVIDWPLVRAIRYWFLQEPHNISGWRRLVVCNIVNLPVNIVSFCREHYGLPHVSVMYKVYLLGRIPITKPLQTFRQMRITITVYKRKTENAQ